MPATLIDLDAAPDARQRPRRHRSSARRLLAALSLLLVALLVSAEPPAPAARPVAMVAAQPDDDIFVHGDRLWVVGAPGAGRSRRMDTYRLPDGKPLTHTALPIDQPVTAVLPVGGITIIETLLGQRLAVMAVDATTGQSRWWRFGFLRGASAGAGLLLLSDDGSQRQIRAFDLRTGVYRWTVVAPAGGSLDVADDANGLPQWLVTEDPHGRLDSYDARTGRRLASTRAVFGPATGVANGLFLRYGNRSGITAYGLPALTMRWHRPDIPPSLGADGFETDCGTLICMIGPTLMAVDPSTGQTRWTSDRWTSAERDGDLLLARSTDGPPDLAPITVLDVATGRVRADLGGWREVSRSGHGLAYLAEIGPRTFFGRFDRSGNFVGLLGRTDLDVKDCAADTGTMVCHLTGGPVAVWRLGSR